MPDLFNRRASLLVVAGNTALDLSEMQFSFHVQQQDVESPNNCAIRVFNLSAKTTKQIQGEFDKVILQAGYGNQYGVIFQGNVKQFRRGRLNATDTYLDILAADGDLAYNFAVMRESLGANSTPDQRFAAITRSLAPFGITAGDVMPYTGGILPRGKVLFAMARAEMRRLAESQGATWSIDNGQLNVVPLSGFRAGDAVVLTASTGMIGLPEQTDNGINVRSLLNPRFVVGGRVQIDNASINQTVQQDPSKPVGPFNVRAGIPQQLATVSDDGLYRIYVAEHRGDTRGQEWYTDLTCLKLIPTTTS